MRGFQPAATGGKGASFLGSGPVRGLGSGTSDEVNDQVQRGTYIMPTDSTQAIGEQQLSTMGKKGNKPIAVNLSNGEFKLSPEQVHAIGVEALDQMKGATHTQVPQRGFVLNEQPLASRPRREPVPTRGFAPGALRSFEGEPPLFFANGGVVDDEKSNGPSPTNIFPGNRLPGSSGSTSAPSVPRGLPEPAVAPMPKSEVLKTQLRGMPDPQFQRDITQRKSLEGQIQSAQANERYDAAGPQMAAEARAAATMRMNRATNRPLAAPTMPPSTGEAALTTHDLATGYNFPASPADAGRGFVNPPLVVPSTLPKPAAATPGSLVTQPAGAGRGAVNPALANPSAAAPTSSQPTATQIEPGVFRSGNSYSDSAAGAVAGPQTRGLPSAQNMTAADALAQQSQQASTARVMAGQPAERGWSGVIGTDPVAGRERKELVSSLMTPLKGSLNGQLTTAQRNGMLSLLDQEARGFQAKANNATALQQTEMQTGTQRDMAAIREVGENGRAVLRESGETGRSSARNAIDQGRLHLEQQTKGFAIRFGEREEKLHQRYEASKTPEEKSAIAQQIRDLSGKAEPTNRFTAVSGGQEWDTTAGAMRNVPGRVFNNQTGKFVELPSTRKLPPLAENPAAMSLLKNTKLSITERRAKLGEMGYSMP